MQLGFETRVERVHHESQHTQRGAPVAENKSRPRLLDGLHFQV